LGLIQQYCPQTLSDSLREAEGRERGAKVN